MRMVRRSISYVIGVQILFLLLISCNSTTEPVTHTDITGVYTCQESSPYSGIRKYIVEVDRVKEMENLYIISNFHNKGINEFLYAELDVDTLRIDNQAISDISIDGKGPVGEDYKIISLYYETDDGITVLDYYASYSR